MIILAAVFAVPPPAARAGSCSELIAKRNKSFDQVKKLREKVSKEKKEVAIAQQGVDLLSGEALVASKKALEEHQGLLKSYEQNLTASEKELKVDEDNLAQCRKGGGGGAETTSGQWVGTWDEGAWIYIVVANGTAHIKYTFSNSGQGNTTKGNGGCATHGNVADCSWVMITGGYLEVYGDSTLTLNGNTIREVKTLTAVQCKVATPECLTIARAYNSAKGKSDTTTWQRK